MKYSISALIIILIIAAGSCTSSRVSVPVHGIYVPADFAGIAHAGNTETQEEYDHLEYAGAKWTLRTLSWRHVELSAGEWDFQVFDGYVDGLNNAGIKLVGLLAYSNRVYNDIEKNRYINSDQLPYFLEYVRQMAERYKGRVDAWCIWNEPNMRHFWRGTQEDFFELTRHTARVIREIDSEVLIIGGSFNRVLTMPEKFIRGLFESGAMEQVDIIAFHPYELNPARSAAAYNRFKNIVADYGFQDRIWITEAGYPTGGWYPHRVSERRFPENIIKTWVLLTASGTNKILWYQLFDPHERRRFNSEDYFGLTRSSQDYTSKGMEAYRLCARYLSGSVCYALTPESNGFYDNSPVILDGYKKSLRVFWFDKTDGGGALVIWNEGVTSRQVTIKLPGTLNEPEGRSFQSTGHLRHNIVTGQSNPIPSEIQIRAGREPVFITW